MFVSGAPPAFAPVAPATPAAPAAAPLGFATPAPWAAARPGLWLSSELELAELQLEQRVR